jgi:hypothetical protein
MREPEFKILALHSDRERAERALRDHFGLDTMDRAAFELPAANEFEPPMDSGTEPQELIPEDWDPEEATAEIWSLDDERFGLKLRDCLRENSIPSRCVFNDPGNSYVYVRPEDESRAREILREITEGKPLSLYPIPET